MEHDEDAWARLRAEARGCTRCELAAGRTQVVFGEGQVPSDLLLVGQGPSESDDATGRNYSGPSGELLDRALHQAGLSRASGYLTNATLCAAFTGEGRLRKLRPPRVAELRACSHWLQAQIALAQPRLIVCFGAPTAQAVIDRGFRLSEQRGQWFALPGGARALATWQPAGLMRLSDHDRPRAVEGWRQLVADLRLVRETLEAL